MQTDWIIKGRREVRCHDAELGELMADGVKANIEANLRDGPGYVLRVPAVMRAGTVQVLDTYIQRWKLKEPGLMTLPPWLMAMHTNSTTYLERKGFHSAAPWGPERISSWSGRPTQKITMIGQHTYRRPCPAHLPGPPTPS